jgi:hypothetical protein
MATLYHECHNFASERIVASPTLRIDEETADRIEAAGA